MVLYLNGDLTKGQAAPQAGTYVGRVQTGMSADGSPIYKYFYDAKEYEQYLSNKRQGDVGEKREASADQGTDEKAAGTSPGKLKAKVQQEHEQSKQKASTPPASKPADKDEVKKSLYVDITPQYLYVKE